MNTFKYGLPGDNNGIYNSLTRVLPYTFDELLSKANGFSRVEDDEIETSGIFEQIKRKGRGNGNSSGGKFDKSKIKIKEYYSTISEDDYKGVIQFLQNQSTRSCLISRINRTLSGQGHG